MEENRMELLECVLTEKELLEYGQQLSRRNNEVTRLESQKKATVSEFTAKVDAAKAEINVLSEKVSTGREWRKVEVEVQFNYPVAGKKRIVRLDTKELVSECNMTADELQDLFIEKERKDKEEAEKKQSEPKGKKSKLPADPMVVEKTLSEVDAPCGEENEGCCQCDALNCRNRRAFFGNAAKCPSLSACSEECPRFINGKDSNKEEKTESVYIYGREDMADCDNAHKLSFLGFIAIMLDYDTKDILEWNTEQLCFVPIDGSPFKTKAAAQRAFDEILVHEKNKLPVKSPNSFLVQDALNACKLFRPDSYDNRIRFQTKDKSWGSPEKFNTEAQFKNRLQELRESHCHFEA